MIYRHNYCHLVPCLPLSNISAFVKQGPSVLLVTMLLIGTMLKVSFITIRLGHLKNLQHKGILLPCSQGNLAQVKDLVYINMEDGMQNYNVEKFEGVTHTWDALQREVF